MTRTKWLIVLAVPPALAAAAVVSYIMLVGPHMKSQPHIRTYDAVMPLPPKGSVPMEAATPLLSEEQAREWKNPIDSTAENIARGRIYYQYYCLFCHGTQGDGNGPVGESYVPVPADLRSDRFQSYSDGELLRAMLTGVGHEPVLESVVQTEHRWPLVLYVRSLAGSEPGEARSGGR